jgi:hypothetical protein
MCGGSDSFAVGTTRGYSNTNVCTILPPGTTGLCEPVHQGVIECLCALCRSHLYACKPARWRTGYFLADCMLGGGVCMVDDGVWKPE